MNTHRKELHPTAPFSLRDRAGWRTRHPCPAYLTLLNLHYVGRNNVACIVFICCWNNSY